MKENKNKNNIELKEIKQIEGSNLSIATNKFLEILAISGEISVRDIGLLSKKYKDINVHVVPSLAKKGYIRKIEKAVVIKQANVSYDVNRSKERDVAKKSYILTEKGKEALLQQNYNLFGYPIEYVAPMFHGESDVSCRNSNQEVASSLVLCELLNINALYSNHPHIYNEIDFDLKHNLIDNVSEDWINFVSEVPVAYSMRVFKNTDIYDDHIKGIQAKMFICANHSIFLVYIMDNKSMENRGNTIESRNEKAKKNNLLYQGLTGGILPHNYACIENGAYFGNALFVIDNINQVSNIFDLKRKSRTIYDSYHRKKEVASRRNIQSIVNNLFTNSFLIIKNDKHLQEHFKMLLYDFSTKKLINSIFFDENEITVIESFYRQYCATNGYYKGITKYAVNTKKYDVASVVPVDDFTIDGKAIYYLWELDIVKLHKSIYENAPNGKIFCCFEDQEEIIKKVIDCYRVVENSKFNINIRSIPRELVLEML